MEQKAIKNLFPEEVSIFQNPISGQANDYPLWRWIDAIIDPKTDRQQKAREIVEELRAGNTDRKYQLPAIMPATLLSHGTTIGRDSLQESIQAMSFYMATVITGIDVPATVSEIRNEAIKSRFIAFAAVSCTADRVAALVKIDDPADHVRHFHKLAEELREVGIYTEPIAGNKTDLWLYTHDPQAAVNPDHETYTKKQELPSDDLPSDKQKEIQKRLGMHL